MIGPMGKERWAKGHRGCHDTYGDNERELAGAAVESAGELDIPSAEGERHLRFEGGVDHLDHLQGEARDDARSVEDDDVNRAEGVSDGEHSSSKVQRIADGEGHVGDGGCGEFAYLGEAGVAPAELDPGDIVADEQAEEHRSEDIDCGEDQCGSAGAFSHDHWNQSAGKGEQGECALEHGAVGIASDTAVGGLEELLELGEEDGDTEVEDDPLRVRLGDVGELQQTGDGEEVEGATEE